MFISVKDILSNFDFVCHKLTNPHVQRNANHLICFRYQILHGKNAALIKCKAYGTNFSRKELIRKLLTHTFRLNDYSERLRTPLDIRVTSKHCLTEPPDSLP